MLPFAAAMTVLVALLLFAIERGHTRAERGLKTAAALVFLARGLHAGALDTTWGTALFIGLCLAAVGDVLLLGESRRMFLGGLVSFLLGHVGYAVAFGMRGLDLGWTLAATAALAVLAVPILRWLWPHVDAPMRGPVIAYVLVITSMVAVAAGTVGVAMDWRLIVGALAFYASDLAVARQRFVERAFLNRAWGLPLYFGAQLLIASTPAA